MSRALFDPRVWLPLAIAALLAGIRESQLVPSHEDERTVVPTELPVPSAAAQPKGDQAYDLDMTRSCVRFLVKGSGPDLLLSCSLVQGTLELCPLPGKSVLELRIDLGSLAPVVLAPEHDPEQDLQHLLGVHRGSEVVYRATLTSSATSPLPALHFLIWQGTLRFGSRAMRQPMALWQTAMPGQPLRLQGHGTVGADAYGLPRRTWLGLVEERHAVTLGLDLAWKRRTSR